MANPTNPPNSTELNSEISELEDSMHEARQFRTLEEQVADMKRRGINPSENFKKWDDDEDDEDEDGDIVIEDDDEDDDDEDDDEVLVEEDDDNDDDEEDIVIVPSKKRSVSDLDEDEPKLSRSQRKRLNKKLKAEASGQKQDKVRDVMASMLTDVLFNF